MSYFAYPDLENIVIQDPGFTDGIRNSMYHEGELFLQNVLWSGGKLSELLLSRKAYVNASLASIYGVLVPGAGRDAGRGHVRFRWTCRQIALVA